MYKDNDYSCSYNGCGVMMGRTWGIAEHPLAMVYSPLQVWGELYDKETALCRGTLFKELDLPFVGCGCENQKSSCAAENGYGCNMNRYGNRGGIRNG